MRISEITLTPQARVANSQVVQPNSQGWVHAFSKYGPVVEQVALEIMSGHVSQAFVTAATTALQNVPLPGGRTLNDIPTINGVWTVQNAISLLWTLVKSAGALAVFLATYSGGMDPDEDRVLKQRQAQMGPSA